MIPYNQLSLADIFSDCQEIYESDKPQFLSLIQKHTNLYEIVPASFRKLKNSFGLAGRKTQNEKTLHADLILSGITQLITVLLADKIHQHQYIRSVKPLIAYDLPQVR